MYIPFHILFYYDLSQDIEYSSLCYTEEGFPGGSVVKKICLQCSRLPAVQEMQVRSLGWEDPLEKGTATHSSVLTWEIPWTEKSGRPQSRGLKSWTRLSDKSPPLCRGVVVYLFCI